MACRKGIALFRGVATGVTAKTIVQLLAGANHRVQVVEASIGFEGTNNTHKPILVELVRQTTAGTMTGLTIVKADSDVGGSFVTTAQHTATAEPTTTDVLRAWTVHPQMGMVVQMHDLADIVLPGGTRIGLRVTADNNVVCHGYLAFVE